MTVTVECQSDRRVAQALLDFLRMSPLRDEQCGACVPQIVEPIQRSMAQIAVGSRTETKVRVQSGAHQCGQVVPTVCGEDESWNTTPAVEGYLGAVLQQQGEKVVEEVALTIWISP